MNQKDNRRVRMTKHLIKDSFLKLLRDKNIRKITVRELCQHADVNRATFYKYYSDTYALFDEIVTEFQSNLNNFLGATEEDMQSRLTRTLEYTASNIDICNLLLMNNSEEYIPSSLLNLPSISNSITETFPEDEKNSSAFTKEFVISGSYSIIVKWLKNNCQEPASEIATLIESLTKKCMEL